MSKEERKTKTFKMKPSVHSRFKEECRINGDDMGLIIEKLLEGYVDTSQKIRGLR